MTDNLKESNSSRKDLTLNQKIFQELKIISNVTFIYEKLMKDGFFNNIKTCLNHIIDSEIKFTVQEISKKKLAASFGGTKSQLTNNSYVYKENLKHILTVTGILMSRSAMEGENEG